MCTVTNNVKALAAGSDHSMLLAQDGSVWATGSNYYGQLGDGSKGERDNFLEVVPSGAVSLAAGRYHSMLLNQNSSVWATGRNDHDQLGDGTADWRKRFVLVVFAGAKAIATGDFHSMVLKHDGSVWAAGSNAFGQLGTDAVIQNSMNFQKIFVSGVKVVAAGALHTLLVKEDVSVWASGQNLFGQLGDIHGPTISKKVFFKVIPSGVQVVVVGYWHNMMLKKMAVCGSAEITSMVNLGTGHQLSDTVLSG